VRVQAYRGFRKWEKGDKTHADAEAGHGSKAAAAMSKGPYLEPICVVIICSEGLISASPRIKRADWDETFEGGTRATSRHVP